MPTQKNLSSGDAVIDAMAKILWGGSWASAYEDAGGNLSGMKIEEAMPPVPMAALIDAARLSGMIEELNGRGLYSLLYAAAKADADAGAGDHEALFADSDYAERFGECLAWQGTGNGVSWFDDHAAFDLKLPLFEPAATMDAAIDAAKEELRPASAP